jgi:LacI family transcriptional regulator
LVRDLLDKARVLHYDDNDTLSEAVVMPTIHDVAKRAGVAPMTVSRVINRSGYFSQETRERVEQAISELGYEPNALARSLRSKRSNTLALVLTDITNPFFTTLARGVEDTARKAGYTVIFCNTDESPQKESEYVRLLMQKQVDGFLLVPAGSDPDSVRLIQQRDTPVVVIDRRVPGVVVDTVRGDSEEGAYQLTRLLLSLGHCRVGILSGPAGISTADDRVAGFRRAMEEAGLGVAEEAVLRGVYNPDSGYRLTLQAMALPNRPTALLAANNFITIGAMKALQELGLDVPGDLALVGFDDLPPAMVTFPFFTVAAQPAYEMGQLATDLLVARLEGRGPARPQEIILPAQIILRRSHLKKI